MKISAETQAILKNFATIEKKFMFVPGNVLMTRTSAVVAEATVKEEFPLEVGIYDLPNFLNVAGLFSDPDFNFAEDALYITESDGRSELRYTYAGIGAVTLPKSRKKRELPSEAIEFALTEEQWNRIQKAVAVLSKPEIKITSDGKTLKIGSTNHKNEGGNSFSITLDADPKGVKCKMVYQRDHLNFLKGSYKGQIGPDFTVFTNTSGYNLTYYVGVEPTTSVFGE